MSDPTNGDRAAWALTAVGSFHGETRYYAFDPFSDGEVLEAAGDLLCNLMHLIQGYGESALQAVKDATEMFLEEVAEELQDLEEVD
ncbi:hypothetical protein [Streptodolium elevatio]|uniref:Uncharacterized protein n=1 Tax=Streptodolium elevatio TaxID=3157996 RepID=A0ABV3DBX0_9ACTN